MWSTSDVAHEFRPGHPIVFWIVILGLVFGFYSASKLLYDLHKCDSVGNGAKHWQVWPPDWVCGK